MPKFTGWKIGTEFVCHTQIVDTDGKLVAVTSCDHKRGEKEEFKLSRLLMAAPDLLAALEAMFDNSVVNGHSAAIRDEATRYDKPNPLKMASEALQKAKGL